MAKDKTETKNKPIYKQSWFIVLALVAVIAIFIGLWYMSTYNSLVQMDENVAGKWSQVETQYQRRFDLIPNLVNTVKEYEQFEQSTLTEITQLRSQWGDAKAAGDINRQVETANELDSALGRLIVVVENYPELQTIQAITSLMDELAGTENRIAVERMRFNEAVQLYNTAIRRFPTNIVANMNGFTAKEYFEAVDLAAQAPTVFG